jgi:UDP-3-O-[3-hydroxymyristoyl] glucosamine N-acyltransferase
MHSLAEISKILNGEIQGDSNILISGLSSLDKANNEHLSYINNNKYINELANTKAGAVIINKELSKECSTNALIVENVYLAFAKASQIFSKKTTYNEGIHKSSVVNNSIISSNCSVGKNVVIGKDSVIGSNVVIGDDVVIGSNADIAPNVCILNKCIIGNNASISPGVVIGSEGFGNALDNNSKWHKINHFGRVTIGDNVTIGANTTIDRGTLKDTEIHSGVRIDNLVHVAHNVIIGEDTAIAGCTGIAGSAIIGKRCLIGGGVGILGHLNVCDDAIISATTTVYKNITSAKTYTGIMPIMLHNKWQNVSMWLTKLDKIIDYLNIKLRNLKEK